MTQSSLENALKGGLPFWEALPEFEKNNLLSAVKVYKCMPGTVISDAAGKGSLGVRVISNGRVRIFINSSEACQLTLKRVLPNEIHTIGVSCVLDIVIFDISIEVEAECEIILLPISDYKRVYNKYPLVKDAAINAIAVKFSDTLRLLESFIFLSAVKRLLHVLIERSSFSKSNILDVTHSELAADIGSPREVVTRLLKKFKENGAVTLLRKKIQINDLEQLIKMRGRILF